ncbi:RHS repeat-associated core domain-containing protein [Nonomuraea basaltis]|uniref:RHS repeat-associated core domain-containing protein n=1 Tax=Nonomuraea basaltis TaxID=2495887 RepID=UPI0014875862|nr:RHS repeat-associated core domain-containing protein [Nonomuraea basaltis]
MKTPPNPGAGEVRHFTTWPNAGETEVVLEGARRAGTAQASTVPVSVASKSGLEAVRVKVADRATARRAAAPGVVVALLPTRGTAGQATVEVGYKSFQHAVGAGFGARARLVRLPECALTTPDVPACQVQTPLRSRNDGNAEVVSADVDIAAKSFTVLAVVPAAAGSNGSFEATSLSPSGTWSVSGNSGSFNWSYPIAVPPVASGTGAGPSVQLSYSSGSVDGRTAATSGQPSWVGQGWDYTPGYIERTFRSCASIEGLPEENKTGDQCWAGDIVTMNLGGQSMPLVYDKDKGWHGESDNGTLIQLHGSGTGEYWQVTKTDGTKYFFGRNKWTGHTDQELTNSAWTTRVYGTKSGDRCYNPAGFAQSGCTQIYRWNADFVEDPQGNVQAYYYAPETNYYGANKETIGVEYTRGGTLRRIDYGLRNVNNTIYGQTATGQVVFDVTERCKPTSDFSCDPSLFTVENATRWPDTPVDQECKKGTVCNNHSPTYWSTKRLAKITTQYNPGTGPVKVDTYDLTQDFPSIGDPQLRLDKIVRTGHAKDGRTLPLPPVEFTSQLYPNRVAGYNNNPSMPHWRLTDVATDTGSIIHVRYSREDCTATSVPGDLANNTRRCYPVYWDLGYHNPDPVKDFFHKYVVDQVEVQDRNAISPTQINAYRYGGNPAWHFDDNEIVEPKYRTHGQFRGYSQVEVRTGNTENRLELDGSKDKQTLTRTTYYRGMGGQVENSLGEKVTDHNAFSGEVHESQTFDGDSDVLISSEITEKEVKRTTATRVRDGLTPLTANVVVTSRARARAPMVAGGTRTSTTSYGYDDIGRVVATNKAGDGVATLCETVSYADNTDKWIRDRVKERLTYKQECPAKEDLSLAVGATRTYYDNSGTLGAIPGPGLATRTETATAKTNGALTFTTTGTSAYDTRGRLTASTDARSKTTRTAYTPADTSLVQTVTTTNAKNQVSTIEREPARGLVVAKVDEGGRRTEADYDPAGRLVSVWLPGRPRNSPSPSISYAYRQSLDQPLAVTAKTLVDNGLLTNYVTKVSLFDGLGQLRQVQSDDLSNPDGVQRRVVKDVFYDSHGWEVLSNNRYLADGVPEAKLVAVAGAVVDDRTHTTFDGAGRPTKSTAYKGLDATRETKTIHGGDRTTVIPPPGGVPSTTVVDVWGQNTALMTYTTPPVVTATALGTKASGGEAHTTTYKHNALGQLESMTDSGGNVWSYGYDFLGRQTSATDPDSGARSVTYDISGLVQSTKDARGQEISYDYDELGRKVAEYKTLNKTAANKLASWTYDTAANGVGKLGHTTRHTPKGAYNVGVSRYDSLGNVAKQTIQIPAGETGFATLYETQMSYTTTGLLRSATKPAVGGLPSETITIEYDRYGQAKSTTGYNEYVSDSTYTPYGEASQYSLGVNESAGWLTYDRDRHTRRVTQANLSAQQDFPQVDDLRYTYDPAGNVTKLVNTQGDTNDNAPVRTQCFTYDKLNRLSQAWSATDNCAAAPSTTAGSVNVGGTAPYWTTWEFDPIGLRKKQVQHALPGATGDTTTTYNYPGSGPDKIRPHALSSTETRGPAGTKNTAYDYNANGSTTSRDVPGGQQTLAWNENGTLASITTSAGTTSYVYDGDNNQLMRRDPGKTTLFLPGEEIVRDNATGHVSATRYYAHNGITVGLRAGGTAVQYVQADQHGTNHVALQSTKDGFVVTRREMDPYGNPLAANGTWPDKRGFLDKPHNEVTGLTDIGAREYDPTTGRFLSVDPLLDASTPQQWAAYTYANNNPTTLSDPSGLSPIYCLMDDCYRATDNKQVAGPKPPTPATALGPGRPGRIDYGGNWSLVVDNSGTAFLNGIVELPWSPLAADVIIPQVKEKFGGDIVTPMGEDDNAEDSVGALMVFCTHDRQLCNETAHQFLLREALRVHALIGTFEGAGRGRGGASQRSVLKAARKLLNEVRESESCSFTGDTLVVMGDGSTKPIAEVKEGDQVLATDPETGETEPRSVKAVSVHDDTVLDLVTQDGAKVTTTEDHPFYSATDGQWKRADQLDSDDILRAPTGGSVKVRGLLLGTLRVASAHNLTVEGLHTYYIKVGKHPVLVHNSCPDFGAGRPKSGNVAVIGRTPDTAVAKDWPGHDVLDIPDDQWSIATNDAWINIVIKNKQDVYVASPLTYENLWDAAKGRQTVTAREIKMFTDAGYKWDGNHMRSPRR